MKFQQNFSQKQQQQQKLAMTQQLQQAIQLLQFNSEELLSYIENKALENPLIEVIEPDRPIDYTISSRSSEETSNYLNQIPDNNMSLFEFLIEQVHLNYRETYLRTLVLYLVEFIDLNGFLTISVEEAAQKTGAEKIQIIDALTLIQRLEPAGVGARDLRECLMLQTERDDYAPELAYIILEEYFEQLVTRKWKEIARVFTIELSEVQRVFDYLQTLSPAPGILYGNESESYIVPDVKVLIQGEEVLVQSNRTSTPTVQFQESYFRRMSAKAVDEETKNYLKEKRQEYEWLKKTILQRGDTILRVSEVIVNHQKEFFVKDDHPVKPLTLKEVADQLSVHESTVSRAVNGKYLETSFGVFELKRFFSTRIATTQPDDSSGELSAESVQKKIQLLVDEENKAKPLSDQKLVELLEKEEISISRRTVAKYRDILGIPSSSKRKRYDK